MNFDLHQFILLVSAGLTVALICYIARLIFVNHKRILNFMDNTANLGMAAFMLLMAGVMFVLSYIGFDIHEPKGYLEAFKVVALFLTLTAISAGLSYCFFLQHKNDIRKKQNAYQA